MIRGADRQRRRRVAGRGNAGVTDIAVLIDAVVARRRDHDDAGLRRLLNRLHERVRRGRLEDRMAERQVDDVDAERSLVGNRELDGADDVAGLAAAVLVQHLEADEADARRDALVWTSAALCRPPIKPATCVP